MATKTFAVYFRRGSPIGRRHTIQNRDSVGSNPTLAIMKKLGILLLLFILGCSNAKDYHWYYVGDADKYRYGPDNPPEDNPGFITIFHWDLNINKPGKERRIYSLIEKDIKNVQRAFAH